MARISVPGFVGPANRLAFQAADTEDLINMLPEIITPGTAQKGPVVYLRDIPGVRPYATVDDTPGYFSFQQDGRAWVVVGTTFAEVFADGTTTVRGTVATSAQVSIVSNGSAGNQLMIVTGGIVYVYDLLTNVVTAVNGTGLWNTPGAGAQSCEFLDGYGIVTQRQSRRWFISALEDFTTWDPLDVFERSRASDNLIALKRKGTLLYLLGSQTSEVWWNSGDALTPFQAYPYLLNYGACNPMSVIRYGEELAFLESGTTGGGRVSLTQGGEGKRTISTKAVEQDIQIDIALNFSWLFTLQMQGHEFLALLLPQIDWTWVYDGATGQWAKWALWNTTTCAWEPYLMSSFMYAFGGGPDAVPLITDRTSGVIYELSFDVHSNGLVT